MLELRGEPVFAAVPIAHFQKKSCGNVRLEHLASLRLAPRASPYPPVETFARALLRPDAAHANAAFARLADIPRDERRLMLEVLAPAARRLGEWWCEDECDFFAVSEGMARLQAILAGLAAPEAESLRAPSLLLLTPPGEAHRFAANLAAELFRREGWRVQRADGDATALRAGGFDAVGVSCGCEKAAAGLPKFLPNIRALTRARRLPLLFGGGFFDRHPARAQSLGADFVVSGSQSPTRIAELLIQARPV